jgi:riboflavin kinase/FMN adenylyltransferase
VYVIRDLKQARQPAAVALGNFDGVHRGHQQVLQPVLESSTGIGTVLTFDPHPRQVLSGKAHTALTPLPERLEILAVLGIKQVVLIPFTREFAALSPEDFIRIVLERGLAACQVSVGWDFCFGQQRAGTSQTLADWGKTVGVDVQLIPPIEWQGQRISSSRLRQLLAAGEIDEANLLMGRPYCLQGEVVVGDRRGRQLGFPTANLAIPDLKVLPRDGVYSGLARWLDGSGPDQRHPAVLNIGLRPTFAGLTRTVEVHLLDWSGDLYGVSLKVDLERFLRPEQKFASIEALRQQLERDCQQARQGHATVPRVSRLIL